MKSETLQDVIALVAEQTGVSPSRITAATRIGEDLGVDGDDASDLLAAFASRFQVHGQVKAMLTPCLKAEGFRQKGTTFRRVLAGWFRSSIFRDRFIGQCCAYFNQRLREYGHDDNGP